MELAKTSAQILADSVYIWNAQAVIPTSGFTHLQNQVGMHSNLEQGGGQIYLPYWEPGRRSFARPRAGLATPR